MGGERIGFFDAVVLAAATGVVVADLVTGLALLTRFNVDVAGEVFSGFLFSLSARSLI